MDGLQTKDLVASELEATGPVHGIPENISGVAKKCLIQMKRSEPPIQLMTISGEEAT